MRNQGIGSAVIVVVVMIIVAVVAGGYFIFLRGGESQKGSSLKVTMTPTQLSEGDNYSIQLTVTNRESENMNIQEVKMRFYQDNQSGDTKVFALTGIISPGETKTVFSYTDTLTEISENGKLRVSLITEDNVTLKDSEKITITK